MRISPVQTSFTSGEISPRLQTRFDLDSYYTGAAKLKNFMCLPHGPLLRRQGTTFIEYAKQDNARLIPFVYSTTQSIVIELGDRYARFFFRGGPIYSGDAPYEISTPWSTAQVWDLDYAQSGDHLFIVHPNVAPQQLVRYGNTDWRISAISFTNKPSQWTNDNWPSHIVFHEQRLYFAATPLQSQTIWGSRVGLYTDFTKKIRLTQAEEDAGEVLDDMAIEYTIASDEVNGIAWMKAINNLVVGTAGAEYKVTSGNSYDAISPTNIRVVRQTSYGSAPIRVCQIGAAVLFCQRGRTRMRLFEYGYVEDQYSANDVTVMSEHILMGKVKEMSLQTVHDPCVWICCQDGSLVCFSYDKNQKVNSWCKQDVGGEVKSVCVIPGGDADEVWVVVKRKNGTFIECFIDAFVEVDSPDQGYFMDSHLSYEGETAISTVGGLDHLEGETVTINVDGWVHRPVVVHDGRVVLDTPGKNVKVGLPYESYFESCTVQSSDQVILGMPKRIYGLSVSLLKSLGFKAGIVNYPSQEVFFGPPRPMGTAVKLYTGTIELKAPASSESEMQVYVKHDMPLPCVIRAIKSDMEVNK